MAARSGPIVTFRGGSGNATVPPDFPVQPPQGAFDGLSAIVGSTQFATINMTDLEITSVDLDVLLNTNYDLLSSVGLNGNEFTVAAVNLVLNQVANSSALGNNGTLDLSGQTPAAPPVLNCMSVAGAGTTAANGAYTPRGTVNGKEFYNLVGQPDSTSNWTIAWADFATGSGVTWGITDGTASLLYLSLDDVATPDLVTTWIVAPSGGSPVPTVTAANAAKVQLVAAGWTVTTD